ncbi:hypothetical protein [Sulfurovum sp. TSL1]|uniref:hypothetical protein n=1 Tax=Sulfurovum sp. TSL1 TaxID=2826994 RepID=UPI001CC6CA50|nr:hypothetical protein [Sulfurovum sp. TSL1]
MYPLMIAVSAFLALSGCDGTTGISSDSGMLTQSPQVPPTEAECLLASGGYETIVIQDIHDNNRTWLDRNLGASEVAAGPYDEAAFGHYYQWGRAADGHQENTSETNDTLATTLEGNDPNTDWYGKFILSNRTNLDWAASNIDNDGSLREQSWSTPYDPNQICPCGYIVPTAQDFVDLNLSDPNTADIFKIAYTDRRAAEDGSIPLPTDRRLAIYWTTTHDNNDSHYYAMYFGEPGKIWDNGKRGAGVPVRCIKPVP